MLHVPRRAMVAHGQARLGPDVPLSAWRDAGLDAQLRRTPRRPAVIMQLALIDLLAATAAVVTAYVARFGALDLDQQVWDVLAVVLLPLLWVLTVAAVRGYDLRFVAVGYDEFGYLARAFMYLTVLTAFVSFIGKLDLARGFVVPALALALVFGCIGRCAARHRLRRMRRAGRELRRVLAVGSVASILRLMDSIRRDPLAGLHIVGACLPGTELNDPGALVDLAAANVEVLGPYGHVRDAVDRCGAASVAVIASDVGTEGVRAISWALESSGADLIVSTGLNEVVGRRVHVQSVGGSPLLRVDAPRFRGLPCLLKYCFDKLGAGLALLVLAPVMAALAVLVRCSSPGPALYRQQRVGLGGRGFDMLKFRTMHVGADELLAELADRNESSGVLFKIHDDPRVTRVGRLLRRYSLDELPQLFNVLAGSMSLVGPRPPLPSEVARYDCDLRRRLLVKPGLTGLWQVSGRSDLPAEEALRLDLHYVENWSLGLDLVVLARTAGAVLKATGAY